MFPIDAADAAATIILAERPRPGQQTVSVRVVGHRDGRLGVETPSYGTGCGPDIVLTYTHEGYDLLIFGEQVRGRLHTLRRVLLTRLAREAAKIPANR